MIIRITQLTHHCIHQKIIINIYVYVYIYVYINYFLK